MPRANVGDPSLPMWEFLFLWSFHGAQGPNELPVCTRNLPSPHGWGHWERPELHWGAQFPPQPHLTPSLRGDTAPLQHPHPHPNVVLRRGLCEPQIYARASIGGFLLCPAFWVLQVPRGSAGVASAQTWALLCCIPLRGLLLERLSSACEHPKGLPAFSSLPAPAPSLHGINHL